MYWVMFGNDMHKHNLYPQLLPQLPMLITGASASPCSSYCAKYSTAKTYAHTTEDQETFTSCSRMSAFIQNIYGWVMMPKWIPFYLHEVISLFQETWLLLAAIKDLSRCTSLQSSEKKNVSHSQLGIPVQVWLTLLSKILSVSVQGLFVTSPFLSCCLPPSPADADSVISPLTHDKQNWWRDIAH